MKKLLLLSALLSFAAASFATGGHHRPVCPGVDAYVPVEAEICYPLIITRLEGIDFGKVNAYEGKTVRPLGFGSGRIDVAGMKNKTINVEFDETIYLNRVGGGDQLEVHPIVIREDLPNDDHSSDFTMVIDDFGFLGLDYLGREILKLGATIPSQLVEPGDYNGLLIVSFTYAE